MKRQQSFIFVALSPSKCLMIMFDDNPNISVEVLSHPGHIRLVRAEIFGNGLTRLPTTLALIRSSPCWCHLCLLTYPTHISTVCITGCLWVIHLLFCLIWTNLGLFWILSRNLCFPNTFPISLFSVLCILTQQ